MTDIPRQNPEIRCGIEFEYLLMGLSGPRQGQVVDFRHLDAATLNGWLADKPGLDDPRLARGDMGIRSGYWYLEGDERFGADGHFSHLVLKGVEIRTPPLPEVAAAVAQLLGIEAQLTEALSAQGLGLALAGFHPELAEYHFDPPLNAFERRLREEDREYDGSEVSTLSVGPDINLSVQDWSPERTLAAAQRLNHYAPWIIPFSFSTPFVAGQRWPGWSYRTWRRSGCRPTVKVYFDAPTLARLPASPLLRPARLPEEVGRIEFKALDCLLDAPQLTACCHLLVGVMLADALPGRSDGIDQTLYRQVAQQGFADPDIYRGAAEILAAAGQALRQHHLPGWDCLHGLHQQLQRGETPALHLVRQAQAWLPRGLGTPCQGVQAQA